MKKVIVVMISVVYVYLISVQAVAAEPELSCNSEDWPSGRGKGYTSYTSLNASVLVTLYSLRDISPYRKVGLKGRKWGCQRSMTFAGEEMEPFTQSLYTGPTGRNLCMEIFKELYLTLGNKEKEQADRAGVKGSKHFFRFKVEVLSRGNNYVITYDPYACELHGGPGWYKNKSGCQDVLRYGSEGRKCTTYGM